MYSSVLKEPIAIVNLYLRNTPKGSPTFHQTVGGFGDLPFVSVASKYSDRIIPPTSLLAVSWLELTLINFLLIS